MSFGWSGQILRVDLSNRKSWVEPTEPYIQSFIGGRGISEKIMYDEVEPEVSPFDPANRLCFAPGVLTGTFAPSSSRMKVTSMASTGLLANPGIGGYIGAEMKFAGYDNLIIQGKSDKPVYLYINNDSVEFRDASHIWGKDTWETQQAIKQETGDSVKVMCIGLGGENLVSFAGIISERGSVAARGGIGAVMGSKNLKAIAVRGTREIKIAKMEEFMTACEEANKTVRKGSLAEARWPTVISDFVGGGEGWAQEGGLSYSRQVGTYFLGNWEPNVSYPNEETIFRGGQDFTDRYGVSWTQCFGCPIGHSCIYDVPGIGVGVTDCFSRVSFYGSVWNPDHKVCFHADYLCDSYGLDQCSAANIISFLMELYHRGIITEKDTDGIAMKRGDENAIISMIHKIGKQEGFGKVLGKGVLQAARTIGRGAEECAMHIKGTEMQQFEVRGNRQQALATAVTGVDTMQNIGLIDYSWPIDKERMEEWAEKLYKSKEAAIPTSYEKKALMSWDFGNRICMLDMLGTCKWFYPWYFSPFVDAPVKLYSLATGRDTTEDELLTAAQRVLTLERAFNVTKGVRRKDDALPERLFENTAPLGLYKGAKLEKQKFDEMVDEYYRLRGWDEEGIPTEETFKKFGLVSEWKVFKKRLGRVVEFHV